MSNPSTEINHEKHNIDSILSKAYAIDFYQREYTWKKETVEILLNDIYRIFEKGYKSHKDLDATKGNATKYPWYYLNIIVTNREGEKHYLVDGQQRLTTLSLIIIALLNLSRNAKFNKDDDTVCRWLEDKIANRVQGKYIYYINHKGCEAIIEGLFKKGEATTDEANITGQNLIENYKIIYSFFENKKLDNNQFERFVHFFMLRLVLLEITMQPDDVPMVFEAINDRGVSLKNHEILKGIVLSKIKKEEVEKYDDIWRKAIKSIQDQESGEIRDDFVDGFFKDYLGAKHANTRSESRKYDDKYHRQFMNACFSKKQEDVSPNDVKSFIKKEFKYFSNLYAKLFGFYNIFNAEYPFIFQNAAHELLSQFRIMLSACQVDDPLEEEKIQCVSKEFERFYMLSNLQNVYNTDGFYEESYIIGLKLKEIKAVEEIRPIFDESLKKLKGEESAFTLEYNAFNNMRYKFSDEKALVIRHLFASIDKFLGEKLGFVNPLTPENIFDITQNTGSAKKKYQFEHILANNEENKRRFSDENKSEKENEREFEGQRNRLGALLLLRGDENASSNNEAYKNKLKTYEGGSLIWNRLLTENYHKNTNKALKEFKEKYPQIILKHYPDGEFDKNAIEERCEALFEMAKIIWEV